MQSVQILLLFNIN